MNAFIRLLYAILIAVAVVVFVGVSVYTFYPAPKAPQYPTSIVTPAEGKEGDFQKQQETYQKSYDQFRESEKNYQRNVSGVLVPLALGIVAGGIWLKKRDEIISEGVALGGVATSIYATIMGAMSENRIMRFVSVTSFLVSAVVVVYYQFREAPKPKKKR